MIQELSERTLIAALPAGIGAGIGIGGQVHAKNQQMIAQHLSTQASVSDSVRHAAALTRLHDMEGQIWQANSQYMADRHAEENTSGDVRGGFANRASTQSARAKDLSQEIQQELIFNPSLSEAEAFQEEANLLSQNTNDQRSPLLYREGLTDGALLYRDECKAGLHIIAGEKEATRDDMLNVIACAVKENDKNPQGWDVADGIAGGVATGLAMLAVGKALKNTEQRPVEKKQQASAAAPPSPPPLPKGPTSLNL